MNNFNQKIKILALIAEYGGIDGGHHKQWIVDQIVRILTGPEYNEWVGMWEAGEDGPQTYKWDSGIAP